MAGSPAQLFSLFGHGPPLPPSRAGVDDAALLHGGDDRAEVVVHEDHVRSALADGVRFGTPN